MSVLMNGLHNYSHQDSVRETLSRLQFQHIWVLYEICLEANIHQSSELITNSISISFFIPLFQCKFSFSVIKNSCFYLLSVLKASVYFYSYLIFVNDKNAA